MKSVILIFLSFYLVNGFAQETKLIQEKTDFQVIKYSVLKNNPAIKHGKYQECDYKGKTIELEGYYKNGQKDSIWTTYSGNGKNITSKGSYLNNLKSGTWTYYDYSGEKMTKSGNFDHDTLVGIWNFYDLNGTLEQTYDYDKDSLMFAENLSSDSEYPIVVDGVSQNAVLERRPSYIGGYNQLIRDIANNLKYPHSALEKNKQGRITVQLTVKADGQATDFKIVKGFDSACENEALRVLNLFKEGWIPAIYQGRKVDSYYYVPVSFKIQ